MNYDAFMIDLRSALERKLMGTTMTLELTRFTKANDMDKDALLIKDNDRDPVPMIYVNDLYEWYQNGADMESIAEDVLDIYRENLTRLPAELPDLKDFSKMKDQITFSVLNTRINEDYLKDAVTIPYLDLSLVLRCTMLFGGGQHIYSTRVTTELMESWNTDPDTLFAYALKNTPRLLGVFCKEVREVILEMLDAQTLADNEDLYRAINDEDRSPMYILSNEARKHGAGTMFLEQPLKDLSGQLKDDLYIIPSSVHEVLVIPVKGRLSRPEVNDMIRDINQSVLRPEDLLSSHVYIYSRREHRITM